MGYGAFIGYLWGAGGRGGADACAMSGDMDKEAGLKPNIIIHCYYRCLREALWHDGKVWLSTAQEAGLEPMHARSVVLWRRRLGWSLISSYTVIIDICAEKKNVEVAKLLCGTYDVHWFRAAAFWRFFLIFSKRVQKQLAPCLFGSLVPRGACATCNEIADCCILLTEPGVYVKYYDSLKKNGGVMKELHGYGQLYVFCVLSGPELFACSRIVSLNLHYNVHIFVWQMYTLVQPTNLTA